MIIIMANRRFEHVSDDFFLPWELVYILERKATVHFQRLEKEENEYLPLLG